MQEIITLKNNIPVVCSLTIADQTEAQHRGVIQLIEAHKEDFENFGGVTFEMRPFETAGGKQLVKVIDLNEHQATLLLTYMRNIKKVRGFKVLLVKQFMECKERLNAPKFKIPATLSEALQLAADQAKQLELQAPKVEFVDNYVQVGDTKTISDVAKMLSIPNRKFFKQLQDDNILFKRDGDYRPYSRYEKFFNMKTGNNGDRSWLQCRVNCEGITYLSKRYGVTG